MKILIENSNLTKDNLKVLYQHCLEEALVGKWVVGKMVADTLYIGRLRIDLITDISKGERIFIVEIYVNSIDLLLEYEQGSDCVLLGNINFHIEELVSKKRFKKELKRCVEELIKIASKNPIADVITLINEKVEEW